MTAADALRILLACAAVLFVAFERRSKVAYAFVKLAWRGLSAKQGGLSVLRSHGGRASWSLTSSMQWA